MLDKEIYERMIQIITKGNMFYYCRIKEAKEYINQFLEIDETGAYYLTHTFDASNLKHLQEILRDVYDETFLEGDNNEL